MRKFSTFFFRDDSGVSTLEYAILAGIIVIAVTALGTSQLTTGFSNIFAALIAKVQTAVQ